MMAVTTRRLLLGILSIVIALHYLLGVSREDYHRLSSLQSLQGLRERFGAQDPQNSISEDIGVTIHNVTVPEFIETNVTVVSADRRANATLLMLCKDSDLVTVINSIQQIEDRFNREKQYPWVLLSNQPFSEQFKRRVSILTGASISFGEIQKEHWHQPDWIDERKAAAGRQRMAAQQIIYADSIPYRNMCRFNSGFFFNHELLKPYRYYWRVEPGVTYFCDLPYDPFLFMEDNNKVYGWTLSLYEWEPTIPTLWQTVKEFMAENPQYVDPDNSMKFLSDNEGLTYNLCHYWSNFEIADMDFWRGEAYQKFFDFLESKGGFYYERWGDAPIHSIAVSLFASKHQMHFFNDIGYKHPPFQRCPSGEHWTKGKCACDPTDTFDYMQNSCLRKYEQLFR